jgi:hypothetical protein
MCGYDVESNLKKLPLDETSGYLTLNERIQQYRAKAVK